MNGNGDTETRGNDQYPAPFFNFHAFSIGLAKHLTASLNMSVMSVPEILFRMELFIFPEKLKELLTRLTAEQPVPNPNSPLGRAISALSRMQRLVEEAKEHIESGEYTKAKEKIFEAEALASDENTFPKPSPAPGLPPNPIANEDMNSVLAEIRFMKNFIGVA